MALGSCARIPQKELDEELGFHLEQRTRDYIDRGMSPEAARDGGGGAIRRCARACATRASRCSRLIAPPRARRTLWRVSWLDVKLGLRMFVKYPGLSLVSVIGMAVAIAIGAGYFTVLGTWLDATLPLPEGDRIVSIRTPGQRVEPGRRVRRGRARSGATRSNRCAISARSATTGAISPPTGART